MPKPEQHTVFRFKLRSLLAITSGVAVLMTLATPWLRVLDDYQWGHLFAVLAVVVVGLSSSLLYFILTRRYIGTQCGKLLLTLQESSPRDLARIEWGCILFGVALAIVYLFFVGDPANRDDIGIVFVPTVFFPYFFWCSTRLAKHGLATWAEGYGRTVEFCESGLVTHNSLHAWDSPTLHELDWTNAGDGIVLNVSHDDLSLLVHRVVTSVARQAIPIPDHRAVAVPVSPRQREGVEAILQHYYRPHRKTVQRQTRPSPDAAQQPLTARSQDHPGFLMRVRR